MLLFDASEIVVEYTSEKGYAKLLSPFGSIHENEDGTITWHPDGWEHGDDEPCPYQPAITFERD